MKIGILGAANSIHIVRIANELVEQGNEVVVISLPNHVDPENQIKCPVHYLKSGGGKGYYLCALEVKKVAQKEKLDILNAHYASGYGTLGRLSKVRPLITSVWGSDIYEFPKQSKFNEKLIKKNLLAADRLFSTSYCMKDEIGKYIGDRKIIDVTPFGIDIDKFKMKEYRDDDSNEITVGFFKGTKEIYGIDFFLDVVSELKTRFGNAGTELKVKICGGGDRTEFITDEISKRNLADIIDFMGIMPYEQMPEVIKSCDIACIPSIEESFGVIAIEAMACGVPCITSGAPGLKEVVVDGVTGYVIESGDYMDYADKIVLITENRTMIKELGINGRDRVEKNYDFKENIKVFIEGFNNER